MTATAREMTATARELAARAVYEGKTIVAMYPSIALPLSRVRGRNHPIGPGTEVVIEGFPRSATSFAVAAFQMAQDRKVDIAHHTHSPAQVIEAVRRGIPALVLIREPEDAILSHLVRRPDLTVGQGLRGYVRFHRPLIRYRRGFVVGTFEQAVTRFGDLMQEVNDAFGTSFVPFEHTPENVRRCMETIDAYVRRNHPPERVEMVAPRPSAERSRHKEILRPKYRAREMASLREKAEQLYRSISIRPT
jgi:hypothetical protein